METVMLSAIHQRLVAAGVEEEFHIVDLATRRLTGQADRLMGQLPADRFSWEMQRVRPELLEAATWRAAQAGLQGDLVDPVTAGPVPAGRLIRQLLAGLRPALESTGDWELMSELARSAMARGSSAARQRAARGSGGLRRVVDTLIAETRAVPPWLPGARRVA
jgi:gamma-glutamyl:cysteine ligase YbdK (ATP-grasp superfamily)